MPSQSGSGTGTPITPSVDSRKGFAFNNPDTTFNNGWGAIITPDEMRYVYAFGLPLVSPDGQVITDETLQWYINCAVKSVEQDLCVTLMKRQVRARPPIDQTRDDIPPGEDTEWEDPYDFDPEDFQRYIFLKLRRRPVIDVQKMSFKNVINQSIIDLRPWLKINHDKGTLEGYPTQGALAAIPFYASPIFPNLAWQFSARYPDAFFVDYTAGYESAAVLYKRNPELFPIIGMLASANLLNDYGDGRTAALATSSVSLAGISESFSTTMSAENAMFGARILMNHRILKAFYQENRYKYSGLLFTAL